MIWISNLKIKFGNIYLFFLLIFKFDFFMVFFTFIDQLKFSGRNLRYWITFEEQNGILRL